MLITAEQFAMIHTEAVEAAERAAAQYVKESLNNRDAFPCGFAWVKVFGVKLNTKLGKIMKEAGFSKSYSGGIDLWNPSRLPYQNVDAKYSGASAYAAVLKSYGINAIAESRWD